MIENNFKTSLFFVPIHTTISKLVEISAKYEYSELPPHENVDQNGNNTKDN